MREDWEYKKLEDISSSLLIEKAKKRFSPNDVIRYIDISSIDNINQCLTGTTSFKMLDAPSRAQQKVEYGDILISTVRPNLRNIAIVNDDATNLVASSGFCVLRINDAALRRYVFYYVVSNKFTAYLEKLTNGANYPAVKETDVRKALIPIPPKPTQLSIVTELDKLNELIRIKKEQLKDYDALAQSIFYEMFGDPVENEKGWEVKKLGELCSKIGSGATPRGGNESYKDEGISLIRSLNVYNNEFRRKDLAYIDDEQAAALSNVTILEDDVLLNITGASVARCCIVPSDLLPARVNQHVCIIRPLENVLVPIFLNKVLTNISYQIRLLTLARSKGATREALPKRVVDSLLVPLPSLSLQQSFAHKIEQIERQKTEVQKTITDLETLLAARMQYWFD